MLFRNESEAEAPPVQSMTVAKPAPAKKIFVPSIIEHSPVNRRTLHCALQITTIYAFGSRSSYDKNWAQLRPWVMAILTAKKANTPAKL